VPLGGTVRLVPVVYSDCVPLGGKFPGLKNWVELSDGAVNPKVLMQLTDPRIELHLSAQ
jgi:hypothetical protein